MDVCRGARQHETDPDARLFQRGPEVSEAFRVRGVETEFMSGPVAGIFLRVCS
jgi:hypothetical protein